MINTIVDEQCSKICEYRSDISTEQLKTSLDIFVSALKETDTPDVKYTLIEQIISPLISLPNKNEKLAECELITHEFFIILRDTVIIDYLHRRSIENNIKQELFLNATLLLKNLCYNIRNDTNIVDIKHLLIHKPLIDELGKSLNEIGIDRKYLNDSLFLRSISFLLLSFKYCWKHRLTSDEYSSITPILHGVVACLCSSYTVDLIRDLKPNFNQTLNTDQILFLDTMPWYLQWYADDCNPENFIKIVRMLLNEFTTWVTNCDPESYLQASPQIGTMIRHLNYFLVRPIGSDNLNKLSEEFYEDYCKLVSYWSAVLSSTLSCPPDKLDINLTTRFIVQNLYNFTLHLNVLNFMKTIPNLISMLLKITDVEYDEIQLNVYRCLGKIMIEKDIKTMANPDKIAAVYIEFITNTIDDTKKEQRFYSLLESLRNFVQHDQVKTELIKQNALHLLVRCIEEIRFDPIKGQQTTLEILVALSFINDACSILQENKKFINHIRILASNINSDKPGSQRAAEMLLWKLEKEEEAIAKPTVLNSYKYDIMISYSHKDQQICFEIHEQLVKDGFRVWIDKDCLRGSTMIGIANAIENSESVLICMSSMYKQSVYCQSEAHYAYERTCRLVPIIIESDYKPDGWLGIIVSGKIYVDFANDEFKLAYQKLSKEIRGQRYRDLAQLSIRSESESQVNTPFLTPQRFESIVDLPDCIVQWTPDHVRSFFLRIGLGCTILPLCTNMNGYHLLQLYEICLMNRESMYQSLKFELNEKHHVLLPIADYITFLHEIKLYIPLTPPIGKLSESSLFSFTVCNIL